MHQPEQDTTIFDVPRPGDRQRIAQMLASDMRDLQVDRSQEELLRVADLILEDEGRSCFCRLVRPAPGEPAVGLVLANITFSVKFAGRALWIENLYVDHAWRKRGLGRRLAAHLLDWAEVNHIRGIDLEAYQGNTPASLLYRSLGFERLGRERFWFDFDWLKDMEP
jgi:ribosomal protein S18 acetylase RimI-like enzyme